MDAATRKLYERKAAVLTAAGHPIRLAIIEFLKDGEQCVCDISKHVAAERSNVSRHLSVLLRSGIVEHRKAGLKMLYSLKTPCVLNFLECVTSVLRDQACENKAILKNL
jgi:ArsR family transcriptional regulator